MNTLLRHPGPACAAAREIELTGHADDAASLAADLVATLATCATPETRLLALADAAAAELQVELPGYTLNITVGAFIALVQDRLAERHGAALQAAARSVP
jgi:hypothetical protein